MSDQAYREGIRNITRCAVELLPKLAEHPVEQAQIRLMTSLLSRFSVPDLPVFMDRLMTLLKPFAEPDDRLLWMALKDDSDCGNQEPYAHSAREMLQAVIKMSELWTLETRY